ncbi:YbaB/EbfC family nucleoid-associated protein [Mycoplasmoides pirum]|uniref:YbaB/EbfC family nucleoid-associated protein n=1 Tax=Mycoplasmoides pirum TaxID=2122 RepID=UPI000483BA61|nr:YbaB/EbfC family nucleoid-associated protein [Mycoplasmoides pirum]
MNFQKMAEMIKKNQKEMEKKLTEFNNKEFSFEYKNKAIQIKILGDLKIKKIEIDKTLIDPEDKTMLEDMVAEAINEAIEEIEKQKDNIAQESMPKMPGFF